MTAIILDYGSVVEFIDDTKSLKVKLEMKNSKAKLKLTFLSPTLESL
jgi:hypothetical protein